jgi:aminoglycoside phosphotransferase (APT) family kinase protein
VIPEDQRAAVTRGLREAFRVTELEDINMLTKGQSGALVYRIILKGSPYLLRIITRKEDPTLPQHFTCMKAAAEAGLAPHVWYTSLEDRISITDFVEAVSFPMADALTRMPAALRSLHALPAFPRRANHLNTSCMFLLNQGPALDGYIQMLRAANILSEAEFAKFLDWHAQLAAVYPRQETDMVSSHNDLFKPDNVLFDGHRVWLVDWEAAFLNDRYADLAVFANLIVTNVAEESVYLEQYFGKPPDECQRARYFLMQQIAHMFYAMAFLWLGSKSKPVDWNQPVPAFADFHRRIWAGEVNLADNDTKIVYGRVHWERLLQNARQPRFKKALKIVKAN